MSANTRAVIVVAAGQGTRSGQVLPKQFVDVCGKPLLQHTLDALSERRFFDALVLVHPVEGHNHTKFSFDAFKSFSLVTGGNSRTQSVRNGIEALASHPPDHVYIHDAARAGVSHDLLLRIDSALSTKTAVIPTLPVADALKRVEAGHIVEDVDRSSLHRVQTPQAFHYDVVRNAYAATTHIAHDCATIVMQSGVSVARVKGDERNFKVTYPEDFQRLEKLLGGSV